tara:strand:+ start:2005 stop:2238 length:234 start_codon:yes stop_codon:yes gene_type:complete
MRLIQNMVPIPTTTNVTTHGHRQKRIAFAAKSEESAENNIFAHIWVSPSCIPKETGSITAIVRWSHSGTIFFGVSDT